MISIRVTFREGHNDITLSFHILFYNRSVGRKTPSEQTN